MEKDNSFVFISILGHLFFLLYILGCILYSEERFLAFDAAFYTFDLVNDEEFAIRNQRYISYFTQLPALIAIKLGLNLNIVIGIFSATFGFWFYGAFLFVNYILKNPKGVLLLIFSLCLTLRYKHFAGHTEIVVAIVVSSLLCIWVWKDKEKLAWYRSWIHWLGLLLLCMLLFIIHPVIVIPLTILMITDICYRQKINKTDVYNLLIVWFTFGLRFSFINSYEQTRTSSLLEMKNVLLNPSKYPIVYEIIQDYLKFEYFIIVPLFIASLVLIMYRGKALAAISLLMGTIALVLLNIVAHSYLGAKMLIMIDGYLGMLGMVFGLAYLYAFYKYSHRFSFRVLLVIFLCINLFQIERKHLFFANRLKAMDKTFEMNDNHPKLFVNIEHYNWDKMWVPYGLPYESIMWTSLKEKNNTKVILVDFRNRGLTQKDNPVERSIMPFDDRPKELNEKYFKWPDNSYLVTDKVGW